MHFALTNERQTALRHVHLIISISHFYTFGRDESSSLVAKQKLQIPTCEKVGHI